MGRYTEDLVKRLLFFNTYGTCCGTAVLQGFSENNKYTPVEPLEADDHNLWVNRAKDVLGNYPYDRVAHVSAVLAEHQRVAFEPVLLELGLEPHTKFMNTNTNNWCTVYQLVRSETTEITPLPVQVVKESKFKKKEEPDVPTLRPSPAHEPIQYFSFAVPGLDHFAPTAAVPATEVQEAAPLRGQPESHQRASEEYQRQGLAPRYVDNNGQLYIRLRSGGIRHVEY